MYCYIIAPLFSSSNIFQSFYKSSRKPFAHAGEQPPKWLSPIQYYYEHSQLRLKSICCACFNIYVCMYSSCPSYKVHQVIVCLHAMCHCEL